MARRIQKWEKSVGIYNRQKVKRSLSINHNSILEVNANNQRNLTLEKLVSSIAEKNRHAEIDFGKPEGKEPW